MRANIIRFSRSQAITAISYLAGGLACRAPSLDLRLRPPRHTAVGLCLASHMFGLASEETFRRICYALIALAALVSLPVFDGVLMRPREKQDPADNSQGGQRRACAMPTKEH